MGTLRALSERALWHVRSEKARALSERCYEERGITKEDMQEARERGHAYEDAYNLREVRKERHMAQVDVADAMDVSPNRVSQIENGDVNAITVSSVRRYVEALGGRLSMEMDLLEERKVLA